MKIKEVSTEPEIIYTGSKFLLKVRVQEGITYDMLTSKSYEDLEDYTYKKLKGE